MTSRCAFGFVLKVMAAFALALGLYCALPSNALADPIDITSYERSDPEWDAWIDSGDYLSRVVASEHAGTYRAGGRVCLPYAGSPVSPHLLYVDDYRLYMTKETTPLTEGVDYEVVGYEKCYDRENVTQPGSFPSWEYYYKDVEAAIEPGFYKMTLRGKGNYTGTCKVSFNISFFSRLAGDNAYGTMARIVGDGWQNADTVVIATFDGYWDALAASALAGKYDAPILLTDKSNLDATTASELERLKAKSAIIVGGEAAVSDNVKRSIEAMGIVTERIAGTDAQATAVEISNRVAADADTCIVATSAGFWDALAASPYAYAKRYPIYLTNDQGILSAETLSAIRAGGFDRAVIAGGTAAVDARTEADLSGAGVKDVRREWGETAIGTSQKLAEFAMFEGLSSAIGVATVNGYWDALTGGPLLGKCGGVLVLASEDDTTSTNLLDGHSSVLANAYLFGGEAALSLRVRDSFENKAFQAALPADTNTDLAAASL